MQIVVRLFPFAFCAVAVTAASYCPPDAFTGPTPKDCYTFGQTPESYDESETICAVDGGHLASVSNAFQNAVLGKVAALAKADYYRLGGLLVGGKWTWSDGTAFTYTNWKKGQPDKTEGCLGIDRSGSWLVVDCAALADYFCKVPPVTVPIPPQVTATTPLPETVCGAQRWTYVPETGKCYRVVHVVESWEERFRTCNDWNGTLVSIHSGSEAVAIEQFVQSYADYRTRQQGYYIGLHDPLGLRLWQWADGTPYDFENWGPGEPAKSGQKCVLAAKGLTADRVDPLWTTVACDDDEFQGNTICQTNPLQH